MLADRVVVMTANPGKVKEIIDIDLPKPRSNASMHEAENFEETRHYIWGLLQNHNEEKEHAEAGREEHLEQKIAYVR